jgi:hypothetical protein
MNRRGRGGRKLNLKGQRFGMLLVSNDREPERYTTPSGNVFYRWWVICDCGIEKQVRAVDLTHNWAVSCGCHRLKMLRGPKDNLKLPPGVGVRNDLLSSYKAGARQRRLEWTLTDEQFDSLIKMNCHYCGALPFGVRTRRGETSTLVYTGIDRKNNQLGYTTDNTLPCCKICNRAKLNLGYDEFMTYIERMSTFHTK